MRRHAKITEVPVDQLTPHPRNANFGDVGAITESIEAHGWLGVLVAQKSSGHILGGNHSWVAAREQNAKTVPVQWVDCDDTEALRIMLALNRTRDLATYDDGGLATLLTELAQSPEGLAGSGFDGDALDELLADLKAAEKSLGSPWDDRAVQVAPAAKTVTLGDVWVCGEHRVVCGDSTDPEIVERALDGRRWALLWTDPPYGIGYGGGGGVEREEIEGDEPDPAVTRAVIGGAVDACIPCADPGATVLVCGPGRPPFRILADLLDDRGILRHTLVWDKGRGVFGRSDYHYVHEIIFYGWVPTGPHFQHPDRTRTTVLKFDGPRDSDDHPTQKPVALVKDGIEHHSRPGETIIDPFAGSGTTLIAAEQVGDRQAVTIEIDPRYVEASLRRYQELTGDKPVRDGEPHDFTST